MMKTPNSQFLIIALVFFVAFCTSCVDAKKAAYFYGVNDTTINSSLSRVPRPVITANDILSIAVNSANPEADIPFNTPNALPPTSGNIGTLATQTTGYLVNEEGMIQLPVLGNIKVAGLTKTEVKDLIAKELSSRKVLVDPVVTIRIINFRVTVMGEVRMPGVVSVPSERISVLEALGLAGDLTVFAKRDNILLVREGENGEKIIRRLNINSKDLFNSPYYYLRSNDVLYVEANAAKLGSAERSMQLLPIILSGVSVIAVIVGIILK